MTDLRTLQTQVSATWWPSPQGSCIKGFCFYQAFLAEEAPAEQGKGTRAVGNGFGVKKSKSSVLCPFVCTTYVFSLACEQPVGL